MWIKLIGWAGIVMLTLAACGRSSRPVAPQDSAYPVPYAVTQNEN